MNISKPLYTTIYAIFILLAISGCAPEVGSDAWCSDMKAKAKGDWTANEAADYTKSCLFK